MDYFYVNREIGEEGRPMLVAVDIVTGCKWARVVEQKGLKYDGTMEWVPKYLVKEMKNWGHHPTK